jgi:hypothetical protein
MRTPKGFRYPLEPLRLKGEWDLVESQVQMAECNRELSAAQARVNELANRFEQECGESRRSEPSPVTLQVHEMRRSFLGLLQRRINAAEASVATAERRREGLATQAAQLRRFNDGLADHRGKAVRDFLHGVESRAEKQADDSWTQRRHHETSKTKERSQREDRQ